jgi:GTP cyclohydrolase I
MDAHKDEHIARQNQPNIEQAKQGIAMFLDAMGFDRQHLHLQDTPERVVECWLAHLLEGYETSPSELLQDIYPDEQGGLILLRDIYVHGICPHHLLPFTGKAHIAYLPDQHIIGLSQLNELVACHTRRLILQETATHDIAHSLMTQLQAKGAGCVIEASHMCMTLRDPQHHKCTVTTSAFVGVFQDNPVWQQALLSR